MNRICFVCLGNICRSPMAEFILKQKLRNNNIDNIIVESRATSYEEEGNDTYYKAKQVLDKNNIKYTKRESTRLEKEDLNKYDVIYYMDDSNLYNIKRILGESNKYKKLSTKDIEDPWYTNNFDKVFEEIDEACNKILDTIKNSK